jgi:hypothetical protein
VRYGEEPFHQPQPAGELRIQLAGQPGRIGEPPASDG